MVKDWSEVEDYAREKEFSALVCGQNFEKYQKIDSNLLILRPLIAYNPVEIKEQLKMFKKVE